MTEVRVPMLHFADGREAAALAAFLTRLVRWDRAAVVRLRSRDRALAVFGRPASFGVLAVRTARLAEAAAPDGEWDSTVSAGELLEGIAESSGSAAVPRPVTGPPWAGLLPPHGGWQRAGELPPARVRAAAGAAVAEFRRRSEELPPERRTRAELDELAEEIWSRDYAGTGLPLRAVHAAQALGFLRPAAAAAGGAVPGESWPGRPGHDGAAPADGAASAGPGDQGQGGSGSGTVDGTAEQPLGLLAAGSWLRLSTPYGSVAVRRQAAPAALSVTPLR